MTTTRTTATEAAFARLASGLLDTIGEMIEARVQYAAANGFEVTDEEIIASVKASLLRNLAA